MTKLRIVADELTLEQVDEMNKLVEEQACGNTTAMAYVYLKGQDTGSQKTTLNDVRKLRLKDIEIVETADEETDEGFLTESA